MHVALLIENTIINNNNDKTKNANETGNNNNVNINNNNVNNKTCNDAKKIKVIIIVVTTCNELSMMHQLLRLQPT